MRVERAQSGDAAAVCALVDEAADWLSRRGIRQWTPGSFPEAAVAPGIARGEVYVVRAGAGLGAALTLVDDDPEVWGPGDGSALVLHKLTVARASAGSGLGVRLLAWACEEAMTRGRRSLRLDCVASNTFLRRYYAAAGFEERGDVDLSRVRLTRFERRLPPRP
ncbi:MAG: GNAT family N-acetyltransferase [Myxococcota bacterium]